MLPTMDIFSSEFILRAIDTVRHSENTSSAATSSLEHLRVERIEEDQPELALRRCPRGREGLDARESCDG